MSRLARAAVVYASRGFLVHPCQEAGKRPLLRHGVSEASSEADTVAEWWRRWPSANVGLATGHLLVVVDLDGAEGLRSWSQLLSGRHQDVTTVTVETGRGRHIWFHSPAAPVRNSAGRVGRGIDVRGSGGYVLAPPSVHPTGVAYTFNRACAVLADWPEWLDNAIRPVLHPTPPTGARPRSKPYGAAALAAETAKVARASEGQRNDILNRAGFALGQLVAAGALDERLVVDQLMRAALQSGLDLDEVSRTTGSAVAAGMRSPR